MFNHVNPCLLKNNPELQHLSCKTSAQTKSAHIEWTVGSLIAEGHFVLLYCNHQADSPLCVGIFGLISGVLQLLDDRDMLFMIPNVLVKIGRRPLAHLVAW